MHTSIIHQIRAWSTCAEPGIPIDEGGRAIRVLDLFCGGGGSSFGARAAGAEIACGVDAWNTALSNYSSNFPNAVAKNQRLEEICPSQLRDEIGDVDILLTSPECTNHTCAKGSAPRSEESRATALETLRYASTFEPEWIILENVVHMRPWSRYGELKDELRRLGYYVLEQTLDASLFGVAQRRRRLFLICCKSGLPQMDFHFRRKKRIVSDILDERGSWKTSALNSNNRSRATLERAERAFAELGYDEPFLIVYYGSDGSGGWQPLNRPLRTITTVDRFALVERVDGEHRMRMLQVPELSRAMGFTSKYKFTDGTRRDKVKILGNGVCPPVMKEIVKAALAQNSSPSDLAPQHDLVRENDLMTTE